MRVVLTTYGSRGSVEPIAALAARLVELGAEARVCAPPDEEFVRRLAELAVPMVPTGRPVRPLVTTVTPGSAAGLAERAAELMRAQFETVAATAEGADVLVATGPLPAVTGARSVAEKLGIRYLHAGHQPVSLPSPHQRPPARRGQPLPADATDNQALWDEDARIANTMFGDMLNTHRAEFGLPPVDDVRDYAFTDHPWLATDPVLSPWRPTGLGVVQTGAWHVTDERPLPADLVEFLDAGAPPVYVGFGSMPMGVLQHVAQPAVEAIRARGHRAVVFRGWADLTPVDDRDDCFVVGEVNHQALFRRSAAVVHHGSAATTTTAAQAGVPQLVVPQGADQPYWAERVTHLGIGAAYDDAVPTADSLAAALGTALTPETRSRAIAVASGLRTDGTTVAAKLLFGTTS
ncbi:glycosyltransferase [Streptomyces sp. NPDC059534]|uniref:glycosyltransferase n=1 Tax=Streptomyces sp. NPDC059534 TaxID=3346859 RepID=UPI003692C17A